MHESTRAHRGLSTARAVLRVTSLLAHNPDGVRADDVAAALGKSVSTAYNLLASLCDENVAVRHAGGVYRLSPAFRELVAAGDEPPPPPPLDHVVEDLFARTHKRSYLGLAHPGHLHVVAERGQQGMPRMAGMDPEIRDNAHALAMGKVGLAVADPQTVRRYLARGLRGFTDRTITEPDALLTELRRIRRTGVAVDREEFGHDICCMAAPVFDRDRRFAGAVGISMTPRALDDEREALAETLRDVARTAGPLVAGARFQACADSREVLAHDHAPDLASSAGSTPR
jgi:DNA-binding IclR family transcriptional regulator